MLFRPTIAASAALLCATLTSAPGHATTWYVAASGSGSTCTTFAPCSNLNTALLVASPGDKIVCLTLPQNGAITVTKSITIDCLSATAPLGDASFTAPDGTLAHVLINLSTSDPIQTVRLRGLHIDGMFATAHGNSSRGIDISLAGAVYIEDCVIANTGFQGIFDHRTAAQTKLFIKDTIVSGTSSVGITAISTSGSTVLDNVTSEKNATFGISVGTGNNVVIRNSVFSGNFTGIKADAGSHVVVSGSTISHNSTGIQSASAVRLSDNYVSFNTTAFSGAAASMGLNRYSSNGSMGTTPSIVTGAPADIGP